MRVSVTAVENYRYYKGSDMPLADILSRLRKQDPPNDAMEAGKAFHSILEHATDGGDMTDAVQDGWAFKFDLDAQISLPEVREVKGTAQHRVHGHDVTLVGVVDALQGRTVYDHKLSNRFDAERYLDSFQWRAYLSMFDADCFIYNVFTASRKGWSVTVRNFDALPLYRYPAMQADVERDLGEFVAFCLDNAPDVLGRKAA